MVVPSYYPMPFWDTILSHLDRKVCKEMLRNSQIFSVHIHFFRVALRSFKIAMNMARPLIFLLEMVNVAMLVYQVATEDLDIWMD